MRASDPPCCLFDFGYNQWHDPSMMTTRDLEYGISQSCILGLVEAIGRSEKEGSDLLAKSNNHQH